MFRICPILLLCITLLLSVFTNRSSATVTVTPASGLCLNNSPGAYSSIGSINIQEGNAADFAVQTGATIILTVPTGFTFQAGTGSVSYTTGRNISAASIAITDTTIIVTYSVGATSKADRIVISGVLARGITAGSAGSILRTGGTATITGDAAGAGVNHGSLTSNGTGILVSSIANGNWSSPATWSSGSVPSCGQDVSISHTVTADITSSNTNITIATGGDLIASNAITVSGTFTITGTGTYTHNNASDASTTIFAGTENFSSTSNLIFNQWYNVNVPLGFLVSGSFGNITFNVSGTWQQDGYFAPAKVRGNLSITAGTLVLDDGTGMSTAITLQDVTITGTGNLTACSGTNRNFTFTTNNFSDNGTGASLTSIMNNCTGVLIWTANGDVTLNDNFSLAENAGSSTGITATLTGNLNITGGNIDFLQSTNAPLTLTVSGRTTISGSPGRVSLVNSGSGALTFNTSYLNVTSASTTAFITGSFSGTNQFTISNDFEITGASSVVYMVDINGYSQTLNLTTGRDLTVTNGDFFIANSNGPVDLNCGRHMTLSSSTTEFNGQACVSNSSLVDLTVSGTLHIGSATYYHTRGEGNILLTVGEALEIDNGYFYGLSHTVAPSAATATFNFQDFIFQGGEAKFFNLKTSAPTTVAVNCSNNFEITWESNSDIVELVSYDGNNDASLNFAVGGNCTIAGNFPSAYFLSSKAGGNETVTITGSISVAGGNVFFVCDNTSTSGVDAHNIITNIGGNIDISGGVTFLSARDGSATITVGGDFIISSGILNLKWLTGAATMTVAGGYTQTGGTFNLHSHTASTTDTIKVMVNGDFSQTAGTFNFDNAAGTGMAEHTLTIKGANCTLGGSAVITHANNLSSNYVFGQIYFTRAGTTIYSRTSSTHTIQHVRQTINAGTTVNASASTYGFQMTSVASSTVTIHNALTINGTLDMGDKILSARQYTAYYSRLSLSGGGRYRTSHTGGLYSGSAGVASSIDGYMLTQNRVGYTLAATSIVEYYGTTTSVITGVPNGIAATANQQYGILEINFTGAAGSTWVYPETADEVHVRTSLLLTDGEFNLDNDHVRTGGGRPINLESGATTSRTNGFIRSETEDGSGVVKWNITTNSSSTIPFGYDATNYIPFTYQQTSGSSGIIQIGTYRTIQANTPFPPTVTHVRDVNGIDNSLETVDRFWNITVPGTATSNLTFSYAASEATGIISPRAQRWEPVIPGWYPPAGTQSNPTSSTTLANGITAFSTWWTLSSLASPLPIELSEFKVVKSGTAAELFWTTQSEINNDYFTIERSANGADFESIMVTPGAGTSSSTLNYNETDKNPLAGRNYYRLKQTDFDGHFSYSEIKSVLFGKSGTFSVYPNPATSESDLTVDVPEKGWYEIRITDAFGRLIYNKSSESYDGESFKINPQQNAMSPGLFFLTVTGTNTGYSQKIILKN